MIAPEPDFPDLSRSRRWWARGAFAAAFAAVVIPLVAAGLVRTLLMLSAGIGGVVVAVAALYWFLTHRGVLRWLSLSLALLSLIAVLVAFVSGRLLWVVLVSAALALLAAACARVALAGPRSVTGMRERAITPVERPFLLMNPRSGGGKVVRFGLPQRAEELGAEVVLLDGPGTLDVTAIARDAVRRGADLLGVAGGDGTQALVAAVAAEHGLPFLVIPAGTRNHFALDLGLDRDDPLASLDALRDGVEFRVDLGTVDGRIFVNNASFGVYAEVVQSPAYRADKAGTVLRMLPDLLNGHSGPRLTARTGDVTVTNPQAVLVSNGAYQSGDLAGLGRRPHLDHGVLGLVTISVGSARQAVGLLGRAHQRGLTRYEAVEVVVDADTAEIPVGVDGESLMVRTPVRCTVRPGALRVLVPHSRPGVRPPAATMDWIRLRQLAGRSQRSESPVRR